MRPTLIIFVKEPRPGRVKTRLARDIGRVGAAWWFRHQTQRLIRRVGHDPRWKTLLAVSPDREGCASRVWPAHLPRIGQGQGDLGRRMVRALNRASADAAPVAVVGADVPGIDRPSIARAFALLGRADVVLGPSPDGGFWLIGRAPGACWPAGLLDGARWSTSHALDDTLARLGPRRTLMTDTLSDIDRRADLVRLGLAVPA
ncbi:MAG: TIGR04282 family arsenosugar biosynthesis glycosyltransferase, partial [Pseudomonadota bacterium]